MRPSVRRAVVIEVTKGDWYLAIERSDTISPPPSHWMEWAISYGPFASVADARTQIDEWHTAYGFAGKRLERIDLNSSTTIPAATIVALTLNASPPYPRRVYARPRSVSAMEIECGGCGSIDLDGMESLGLIANQNPDGPWVVTCHECGLEMDVYADVIDAMEGNQNAN